MPGTHNLYTKLLETRSPAGGRIYVTGTTKPVDTTAGYEEGCLFFKTDSASINTFFYMNIGSVTSCEFVAVSDTVASLALAEGSALVGNSSGVATAIDASGDTKILIGNATTLASFALSVDATMTNAGVVTVVGATGAFAAGGIVALNAGAGTAAANAVLMGIGTEGDPSTTATADDKFIELRCETTATSGDNRLLYMQYIINGTTGGECLRARTYLTAAGTTAHGGHISLEYAAGSISGLGVGMRGQLMLDDAAQTTGTLFGTQSEIYMSGTSSDLPSSHAIASFVAAGNATGVANVLNAQAFAGSAGSGKMVYNNDSTSATESNGSIRILVDEGSGYAVRHLRYWDSENS